MSAISSTQQKMEDRLCSFRQELVSSQEESTVKALKRARYDKALTFRKKGNEEQHKFNERLGTELENVTIVYLEHKSNFRFYLVICIRVFIKTAKINPRQIQGLTKTLKLVHANNSVLKVYQNGRELLATMSTVLHSHQNFVQSHCTMQAFDVSICLYFFPPFPFAMILIW